MRFSHVMLITCHSQMFYKKLSLNIPQTSQEPTCARILFLISVQPATLSLLFYVKDKKKIKKGFIFVRNMFIFMRKNFFFGSCSKMK